MELAGRKTAGPKQQSLDLNMMVALIRLDEEAWIAEGQAAEVKVVG